MSKRSLVYLDTSVIVAILLNEDRGKLAVDVLEAFQNGVRECVISPLVIGEIYGTPKIREVTRAGMARTAAKKAALGDILRVDKFLEQLEGWDACILIENTRRQGIMVREFGLRHQLKGPDAMHLAAAIEAGCSNLFTFDRDLLKIGSEQGVEISEPYLLGHIELSDADDEEGNVDDDELTEYPELGIIPGLDV